MASQRELEASGGLVDETELEPRMWAGAEVICDTRALFCKRYYRRVSCGDPTQRKLIGNFLPASLALKPLLSRAHLSRNRRQCRFRHYLHLPMC